MWIDGVHARLVPAVAARSQDWTLNRFSFVVVGWGHDGNFESSDLAPIIWMAILCEANRFAVKHQHAAAGSGNAMVPFDDWTAGVFMPRPKQIVCKVKSQRVVLERSRARKQPPPVLEITNGRIGALAFNQGAHGRPVSRKWISLVYSHGARLLRLGDHIVRILPLEDVWIRQVARLGQHDLPVFPIQPVGAHGQRDLALITLAVHDFKEHIPAAFDLDHKRIGYKGGGHV